MRYTNPRLLYFTLKQFFNGDTDEKLCDVTITPNMVYKKLNKLKMNKTPSVDLGVPWRVLWKANVRLPIGRQ